MFADQYIIVDDEYIILLLLAKNIAEIRRLMIKEQNEPLMIKAEPSNPMALISTHNLLANNPHISPRYISDQAQAIAHFEDMERLLGDDCIHACMRRLNSLPHSLRIRDITPQQG